MLNNILKKVRENFNLLKGIHSNRTIPVSVSVNITNKCNQRCIYCEIGQGFTGSDIDLLSIDDMHWISQEMKQARIPTLILGGGEPLLFGKLPEVIEYSFQSNIRTTILSNGMLIPKLSDPDLQMMSRCDSTVFISIDSFQDDKEAFIRGIPHALTSQIKAVELLVAHQIPVYIVSVISRHNYDQLLDIVKRGIALGVKAVYFQPVLYTSNFPDTAPITDKKDINIPPEHLRTIYDQFDEILKIQRSSGITTNISMLKHWLEDYILSLSLVQDKQVFFRRLLNRFYCYSLNFDIAINYNGEIMPCNILTPGGSIKNRNGKGLLEIWNETCQPIRSLIERQKYPEACKSCVCMFNSNLKCSLFRYPFSNSPVLFKIMVSKLMS